MKQERRRKGKEDDLYKSLVQCQTCGISSKEKKLFVCSNCRAEHYCSKECQTKHWKQGGHKNYCEEKKRLIQASLKNDTGEANLIILKNWVKLHRATLQFLTAHGLKLGSSAPENYFCIFFLTLSNFYCLTF